MKETLSPRDRALLAILGVTILYVVAAIVWFTSLQRKWSVALKQLGRERDKVAAENRLIAETDRWNMEYLAEKAKMPQFPEDEDIDTHWLNAMDALAATNSFFISKRQAGKEKEVGDVYEQPIDVSWEGSLESLVRFMWDMRSAEETMMDVDSVNVRPSSRKGFLKGTMTLSCAYMRGNAPDEDERKNAAADAEASEADAADEAAGTPEEGAAETETPADAAGGASE